MKTLTIEDDDRALVESIAWSIAKTLPQDNTIVEVEDLRQAGYEVLLEAKKAYDPTRKAAFRTYAGIRIHGAMMDALREHDWTPRSVHKHRRELSTAIRELEQSLKRQPRPSEIAEKLDITTEEYFAWERDCVEANILSLDTPASDDPESSTYEVPSSEKSILEDLLGEETFRICDRALKKLPDREYLVLMLNFKDEQNLREIGKVFDVSESRICQLRTQALNRMRHLLEEAELCS